MNNIEEYEKFKEKSIAEFYVAIRNAEIAYEKELKNKNLIEAYKILKYKLKLEHLLRKKTAHGTKYGYDLHKKP